MDAGVTSVAAADGAAVDDGGGAMATPQGCVYTWGRGAYCLGLEASDAARDKQNICVFPARVRGVLADVNVVAVDCGESCTAAVSDEGNLYTWGSGRGGRLGTGSEDDAPMPVRVGGALRDVNVVAVSVGEYHCGCVTDTGRVFMWGNGGKGALGDGVMSRHNAMEPVELLAAKGGGPFDDAVTIECSFQNTAVVTGAGKLYVFGDNTRAKLGLPAEYGSAVAWPVCMEKLSAAGVTSVSLGSHYGAAVTRAGHLYTFGYGGAGNLGHGTRKSSRYPKLVAALRDAGVHCASVSCTQGQIGMVTGGSREGQEGPHTFVVDRDGGVWAMGTAHKGILGNLTKKALCPSGCDELLPYKLGGIARDITKTETATRYFSGECVVQAVAAHIHSAVLTATGTLYTFGCGSDGRMATDKYVNGLSGGRSRLKCYVSPPTPIGGNVSVANGCRIVAVASSRRHMCSLVHNFGGRRVSSVQFAMPPQRSDDA